MPDELIARGRTKAPAPLLQILGHLLGDHDVLHALQHRLTLAEIQPQRFHGKLRSFDRHDIAALLFAFVLPHHFHPEFHANLRYCSSFAKRSLASNKLNRSGVSGPDSPTADPG